MLEGGLERKIMREKNKMSELNMKKEGTEQKGRREGKEEAEEEGEEKKREGNFKQEMREKEEWIGKKIRGEELKGGKGHREGGREGEIDQRRRKCK